METPILSNPQQTKSNLWIGLMIWVHIIILNILFVILIYALNAFLNISSWDFWIYIKEVLNILILLFAVWYGLRSVFKRTAVNLENHFWISFFAVLISLLIQILIVLFVVFAKAEVSILGIAPALIWLSISSLILQDIVVFISVFYFLKRKTQGMSVENLSKYTLGFVVFLLLAVSANATTYYFISKWSQESLQSQDFQKKLISVSRPDENPYYSISLPSEWKVGKNDIGAGLDTRLIGYTYGPYVDLSCEPLWPAECDLTAPSNVNLSVFVYENSTGLNARDYVKTLYESFPYPAKLSDGFVSTSFEIIPKTEIRGEGVKITNYFVGGDRGYQYYFTNSSYIYWILVDYKFSKVDTEKGIKESYQKLSDEYQLVIDYLVDSFTPVIPKETASQDQTANEIDIKIGDKLGEMAVLSINPYNSSFGPISKNNVKIVLHGPITVTGRYEYLVSEGYGTIGPCMSDFDMDSLQKLPWIGSEEDQSKQWFCFSNEDQALRDLGKSSKLVTVSIDNYVLKSYPSEVIDTAELVRVIK